GPSLPSSDKLPSPRAPLAIRTAQPMRNADFGYDINRLIGAIETIIAPASSPPVAPPPYPNQPLAPAPAVVYEPSPLYKGMIFRREKTQTVQGAYGVVFEACLLPLGDIDVTIASANRALGTMAGRKRMMGQNAFYLFVRVQPSGPNQCTVTAASGLIYIAIADYGRNAANVSRFFEVLQPRLAGILSNP